MSPPAEELLGKGLTQGQSGKGGGGSRETPSRSAPPPSSRPRPTSPSLPAKKSRPVPAPRAAEDDEIQEVAVPTVKTEPVQLNQQHGGEQDQQQYQTGALQQLDQQVLFLTDILWTSKIFRWNMMRVGTKTMGDMTGGPVTEPTWRRLQPTKVS